ncbi:glycine-rich cell wall structural protein 1-like [Olea europaea var. sylvestris]|uniref:glycine-rich cell wall structural protein 1-like n=1 Tax=Olea europaea var. sylvestris TaxID=158386 RepID=UPI000C1D432E|nr:glycine-rich cell wall structural protein 1-like [Olea europaea var. sylvestris]
MVCGGQCEVVVMCSDGGVSGRVFVSIYWDGHGGATMMFDGGGDGSADNDVGLDGGCMLLCLAGGFVGSNGGRGFVGPGGSCGRRGVGGGKFGGVSSGGGHDGRHGDSGGLAVVVVGYDVVW